MTDATLDLPGRDPTAAAEPAPDATTTTIPLPNTRKPPAFASASLSLGLAAQLTFGGPALGNPIRPADDTVTISQSYFEQAPRLSAATSSERNLAPVSAPVARIKNLVSLTYNWDSYGAFPPSQNAVSEAIRFVTTAWTDFGANAPLRALPGTIAPLPSGGIQLGWRSMGAEIELEISPRGFLSYLFIDRSGAAPTYRESDDVAWPDALARVQDVLNA